MILSGTFLCKLIVQGIFSSTIKIMMDRLVRMLFRLYFRFGGGINVKFFLLFVVQSF